MKKREVPTSSYRVERREEPCSVMKPSCEEPAVNSGMKSGVFYV